MSGDRERCLRAGMDDYLSKPIHQNELQSIMDKWASGAKQNIKVPVKAPVHRSRDQTGEIRFDPDVLKRYGELQKENGSDVIGNIIASYLKDTPAMLQSLTDAMSNKDPEAIRQTAHSMKSVNRIVGAIRMADICQELEITGRQGSLKNGEQLLGDLKKEFLYTRHQLSAVLGKSSANTVDPSPSQKLNSRNILIMDDDELCRDIVLRMFEHLGCAVELAHNGEQAIEIYQAAVASGQPFDLVIVDLNISQGIGGRETAKIILKNNPSAQIIVSSGSSNVLEMTHFRQYGFCAALPKPVSLKDLTDVLSSIHYT